MSKTPTPPADTPSVHPRNKLNELTGSEWLYFTKSVLRTSYPAACGHKLRKEHGANKPPQLMSEIIQYFTKPGELVLDPFAGVGGTLLGAGLCGRQGVGIELNRRWKQVYHAVCKQEGMERQALHVGDCRARLKTMARRGEMVDFIATDPPYSIALAKTMCDGRYDIQHRRTDFDRFNAPDDKRDLRNLTTFEDYYDAMEEVSRLLHGVLRLGRYLVMILRDSYQDGQYVMASYEVSQRVVRAGFTMKGMRIWYQTGARVRPYGYPHAYVPNIVHQNILVFRKENG